MKKLFLLFCTLYIVHRTCYSQDIHFTQFTESPLTVNPAQAGTTAWIRGVVQYRTQWSSITIPYKTISASFDQKIKKRWARGEGTKFFRRVSETGLGWGVNLFSDKAGTSQMGTTQANLSLAYQMKTGEHTRLAMGLQGGFAQRAVQYNALKWGNQYNGSNYDPNLSPQENFSDNNINYPDFGTGILWSYKKNEKYMRGNDQRDIYIGASAFHLFEPSYSFFGTKEKLYRKFVVHGHSLLGIKNTNYSFTPSFMYARQGSAQELLFGTLVRYMLKEDSRYTGNVKGSALAAGGYYRNKDAVMFAVQYEFSAYAIGLSYDVNVSNLQPASSGRGGFEITLRYLNPSPFLFSQARFN